MPNIKSAKKRVEITKQNRAINKSYKSELATAMKKFTAAVKAEDRELAVKLLPETFAILDKNVTRNIIHKNKADRKKAEFSAMLQNMAAKEVVAPKAKAEKAPVETVEVKSEEKTEKKPAAKKRATSSKKTETK